MTIPDKYTTQFWPWGWPSAKLQIMQEQFFVKNSPDSADSLPTMLTSKPSRYFMVFSFKGCQARGGLFMGSFTMTGLKFRNGLDMQSLRRGLGKQELFCILAQILKQLQFWDGQNYAGSIVPPYLPLSSYSASQFKAQQLKLTTIISAKMTQRRVKAGKSYGHYKPTRQPQTFRVSNDDVGGPEALQSKKRRVMNYKLIQIEGIPKHLASAKLLSSKYYLGRYGAIENIFLSQPKDTESGEDEVCKAYVTYESEANSSLALLGVHNAEIKGEKILAFFGTNRYCHKFLMGEPCKKSHCFYLHTYDLQNEANLPEHSREKHLNRAFSSIINNLHKVVWMEKDEPRDESNPSQCYFRSIKSIFTRMMKKGLIKEEEYEKAQKKGKVASEKIVVLKKSISQVKEPSSLPGIFQIEKKKEVQKKERKMSGVVFLSCSHQIFTTCESSEMGNESQESFNDINDKIAEKIIKELSKKRSLSRLQFARGDKMLSQRLFQPLESEKTRLIRQKMTKSLLENDFNWLI